MFLKALLCLLLAFSSLLWMSPGRGIRSFTACGGGWSYFAHVDAARGFPTSRAREISHVVECPSASRSPHTKYPREQQLHKALQPSLVRSSLQCA